MKERHAIGISFLDSDNESVIKAASLGIVNGVGEGSFAPYDNITREQFCVIIRNTAPKMGLDVSTTASAIDTNAYTDWNLVSSWVSDAVSYCISNGTITRA